MVPFKITFLPSKGTGLLFCSAPHETFKIRIHNHMILKIPPWCFSSIGTFWMSLTYIMEYDMCSTSPIQNHPSFTSLRSPMAAQTEIPSWLTDSDLAILTDDFDSDWNSELLISQLFGEHCSLKLRFLNHWQYPILNTYRYIHRYSCCYNVECW